jgi:hypothetical protein
MKTLSIKNSTIQFLTFVSQNSQETVDIVFRDGDLRTSQKMIAKLFGIERSGVSKHISNIFKDGELDEKVVCEDFALTTVHGALPDKTQQKEVKFYNLDMIIAIGYRANSLQATDFRRWATKVLKEFAKKGYILDRKRMENGKFFDEDYFEHLLDEIREIRLSERRFYQKLTDIYALASDYDSKSPTTIKFFQTIQNKMHYAVHQHTAPELIYERANSEKDHMGLTTRENALEGKIVKGDVVIAKNYLTKDELASLGRIVNAYLDLAEERAKKLIPMTMQDWIAHLDRILSADDKELLQDAGTISTEIAQTHALGEFEKYRIKQDQLFQSDFDKFLDLAKEV